MMQNSIMAYEFFKYINNGGFHKVYVTRLLVHLFIYRISKKYVLNSYLKYKLS